MARIVRRDRVDRVTKHEEVIEEHLRYVCPKCGFSRREPCKDAASSLVH